MKEGEVLLISARDDSGEFFWSFPKGHQEIGETDTETALRETKEETNLDVEIIDASPIKTGHPIRGGSAYKTILLFVARPLNDEPIPQEGEVERIQWVQFDEAEKYLTDYYGDAWRDAMIKINNAQR